MIFLTTLFSIILYFSVESLTTNYNVWSTIFFTFLNVVSFLLWIRYGYIFITTYFMENVYNFEEYENKGK